MLGLGLPAGGGAIDVLSSSGFPSSATTTGGAAAFACAIFFRRYNKNATAAIRPVPSTEPATAPAITAVFDVFFSVVPSPDPSDGLPVGLLPPVCWAPPECPFGLGVGCETIKNQY